MNTNTMNNDVNNSRQLHFAFIAGVVSALAVVAIIGIAFYVGMWFAGKKERNNDKEKIGVIQRDIHDAYDKVQLWEGGSYTGPRHGDRKMLNLPGGATMTMIYVAPGSFVMGSPSSEEWRDDDETQHHVTLTKGYWLGETEVTQAQWESVMGSNPSYFKSATRPVENVSSDDCQKFIAKVNNEARRQFGGDARLPTEAEWEYACRAGTNTALSNGKLTILDKNNGPELDEVAWYGGNSSVGFELSNGHDCSGWPKKQYEGTKAGTHPVAKKAKNSWGFYDMHGNVWEWCQDWYGTYPSGAVTDPTGSASGALRVLRGGSWYDIARFCRSADRYRSWHDHRYRNCGFRLACSVGPRD